ncbi:MAG: hypothetical protein NT067_06415 [Candidatus Diapherotrites archaeon]|nr:hypothetical protein [Candidatus Diapherotrites archaeon]
MKFLGERGQAFSTFQLLIAAVVAMVILVILLGVLNIIKWPWLGDDPATSAGTALKDAYNGQYSVKGTQKSTFDGESTIIRKAVLTKAELGIGEEQVCLSLGDFCGEGASCPGTGNFTGSEVSISHSGNEKREVVFSALCAPATELEGIVGSEGEGTYPQIKKDWVRNCKCVTEPIGSGLPCCIVFMKYAT